MYKSTTRRRTSWQKLMCQCFGHQMVDGMKYHSATKRGCSSVCQRCGIYEVMEEVITCPSSPINTPSITALR